MEKSVLITLIIVAGLALLIIAHRVIHQLLRFKMDESAIVKFMQESDGGHHFECQAISAGTHICAERVKQVCCKSRLLECKNEDTDAWRPK